MLPNTSPPTTPETSDKFAERKSDFDGKVDMTDKNPDVIAKSDNIQSNEYNEDSEQYTSYTTAIADALKWTCLCGKLL